MEPQAPGDESLGVQPLGRRGGEGGEGGRAKCVLGGHSCPAPWPPVGGCSDVQEPLFGNQTRSGNLRRGRVPRRRCKSQPLAG